MDGVDENLPSKSNDMKKQEIWKQHLSRDVMLGGELWTDGLICAFEFVQGRRKAAGMRSALKIPSLQQNSVEATKQPLMSALTKQLRKETNKKSAQQAPLFVDSNGDSPDGQNHNQDYHLGHLHTRERFTDECFRQSKLMLIGPRNLMSALMRKMKPQLQMLQLPVGNALWGQPGGVT